jgi:hypothetical protein
VEIVLRTIPTHTMTICLDQWKPRGGGGFNHQLATVLNFYFQVSNRPNTPFFLRTTIDPRVLPLTYPLFFG